ncbi:unnamed protein product [Paramecium primaurelia]|uniref:Uncharacterized protein n=1 Tax=Paramecium primaurelia TaxID=5886 RepID=A0A8S1PS60_PARPR|nr:unnamed protein product [Paramecium primaurelia]
MMKISFILFATFQVFRQSKNISNIQCACQQIISETECNNWNCQWIYTPAQGVIPQTGYCDQVSCEQLKQQQCQNEYTRCYYQESNSSISQVCYRFSKCEDLILTSRQTCQELNPKCVQSQINLTKCIESGLQCQGLSQNQCGGTQQTNSTITLANEGMCFWNGSSCNVVKQCEELSQEKLCTKKWLQNACQWTGTKCVSLTCSSILQSNTCKFVQTTPLNDAIIQPCIWNGQYCINATSDQLTKQTCASNTNYFYRWLPVDYQNGICAQCNKYQYQFRNECECDQLFLQSECNSSLYCKWNNNTCNKLQCSEITSQQQCAIIQGCYWNALLLPSKCLPYNNCQNILGKLDSLCIQASIYCPGSNGINCLSQQQLPNCSKLFNTTPIQPNICYNSIGSDGYCTYDITNSSCSNIQNCSQLTSLQLCNQFNYACIWNTDNHCQQKQCKDYHTKESCTYIQNSINNSIINICSWNPDTQQCNYFNNSINYDVNQCYNQTGRTHHWSQSNVQKGLCLPCQFSNLLNVKSTCKCKDLINQIDCISSFPNCFWSYSNQTCNPLQCNQLTNQAQCILNQECYWKNSQCYQQVNSTSSFCSQLKGNTQQECLSQSILCPGITDEGYCSQSINNCSDYKLYYQCFGSLGADGICQWNQNQLSCLGVKNCNMIKNKSLCNNMVGACYWDLYNQSNNCTQYNCTTLYNQTQKCNYYLSSPNQQYEVKLCYLNGDICNSTTQVNNLDAYNCYNSSGRTAGWNTRNLTDGSCVLCYDQLISSSIIILISILF